DGQGNPAVVEALVRDGGLRGSVRRYGQPVRALPGPRRARRARGPARTGAAPGRRAERRPLATYRRKVGGRKPSRAAVREALPETLPAARAPQRTRREQAVRRTRTRPRARQRGIRRDGSGTPRLDGACEAGAARALPAPVLR